MAQEIVGVKIQVEGNASESIGSLKKQLREAQNEVTAMSEKFGVASDQAVKAAKRAAELKDAIGDAKALTDAFNPDRKFQAFASALTGVVGGISAVQGAMGLLGVENEAVEQTLLKVNSAMALSQGLNSILEARDSFKNLGTVIQQTAIFQKANNAATTVAIALQKAFGVATIGTGRAFTILKGAIAATGIGLLVVGLTTLIGKIQEWTSSSDKAAEAQKKLAAETDLINAKLDNQISVLTALGGKEKEIYQLKLQQTRNELAVLDAAEKGKKKLTDEEIKRKGDLSTQLQVLDIQEKNRLAKIDEDAKKKQLEKNKEFNEKYLQKQKERKEAERKLLDDRVAFQDEIDEQIRKKVDKNLEIIKNREDFFNNAREKSLVSLDKRIQTQVTQSLTERITLTNELLIGEQDREISSIEAQYNRKFEIIKGNEAAEIALREETERLKTDVKLKYENQRLAIAKTALSNIANVVGKETAAGKAIAIATATIDTYQAANNALKANYGIFGPAAQVARFIAVASTIAAGIKNVKEIAKAKVPNSGGASASVPAGISSIATSAPISTQLPIQATLTQLNQGTINQLGSATNRAYVVESDVTNSQERIRRINRAARLN